MIDWLRTSVGAHPGWWSLAFNAVFCTLVGAAVSLARSGRLTMEPLIISSCVGLSICGCMLVGHVYWAPRLPRLLVTILMLACGLLLGLAAGGTLVEGRPLMLLGNAYAPLSGALLGVFTIGGFYAVENWWETRARLGRAERDALARDKALAEAELRVLQALRMAGRMTWEVTVDAGLEALSMPPLLVQPLVENAVLHGIEPAAAGGHVAVRAARRDGGVRIRISDDGVGLDPETAGHGIGIASVRERLRATFGDGARLTLSVTHGGGVSAELQIPPAAAADLSAE